MSSRGRPASGVFDSGTHPSADASAAPAGVSFSSKRPHECPRRDSCFHPHAIAARPACVLPADLCSLLGDRGSTGASGSGPDAPRRPPLAALLRLPRPAPRREHRHAGHARAGRHHPPVLGPRSLARPPGLLDRRHGRAVRGLRPDRPGDRNCTGRMARPRLAWPPRLPACHRHSAHATAMDGHVRHG
jgi:hypothetical protein